MNRPPLNYPYGDYDRFSVMYASSANNGYFIGFGWDLFKDVINPATRDVGKFVDNAVKTAGKEIGKAEHAISDVVGNINIGDLVKGIPIIGGPIDTMFSATWNVVTGPISIAISVVGGERIDKAILNGLNKELQSIKEAGPYIQMVVSFVPGIGSGVSACLGAGLALMSGQPITDALAAGAIGLIPGGPIAKAGASLAFSTIKSAVDGKVDINSLANSGLGALSAGLNLPPFAKNGILAAVTMTGQLANGVKPETAISSGVIDALPVDATAKSAMHQAGDIALALAHGERADRVLIQKVDNIANFLPMSDSVKKDIKSALQTGRGILEGKQSPEDILKVALQTSTADKILSSIKLPPDLNKALQSGMAIGTGAVKQLHRAEELGQGLVGKFTQVGIQLAKTVPAIGEARKLVGQGTAGFDLAHGLLQQQAGVFDIVSMRSKLTNDIDRKGFDMGMANKIGLTAMKMDSHGSAAYHAGASMTIGMRGYLPENKASMMASITKNASATVGATVAVNAIQKSQDNWFVRILKAIGLIK